MAEEVLYSSAGGESNKRKYEISPPPAAARRTTGFSSAPESAAPPHSYNSVPPPMSEIEIAKQKAQEIAARLLSSADPLKKARFDNGGGGGGGYDSSDYSVPKPMGFGYSGQPQVASSGGYPGPSKKIDVPNGRVGVIIGKGGDTIKYFQLQSGAKIQVTRDMDADPNSATRTVELMGTPDQIAKAEQLINDVLSEAELSGSGTVSRRLTGQTPGSEHFEMKVANNKVGLVIGKGGETIKSMQASTGARIQVIPLHLPPGDMSKERTVHIDGTTEQIEAAKQLVEEVTSENRVRNPTMSSGYSSQQGYQAPPSNNYGPPMQQPGYGYAQPGAYPGQAAHYNPNQPPYTGYPPQSTAPQNQQQTVQGGGYDYYNQQPQQTQGGASNPPPDGSGYNYSQAPPSYSQGQVYAQDAYGNYQVPSGYDQQQQGYNNANYGNVSNPTAEGSTNPSYGTQGEINQVPPPGSQSQPMANQTYPPQVGYGGAQAQAQAGYGPPQPQKSLPGSQTAVYAQQPPAQGQPGYAVTQTGYGALPYGAPQPAQGQPGYAAGYGVPPYGAPPHPGYAQYHQQAYSSTYSQGPAYAADAAPDPPSGQAGGPAKASPPS